MIPFLTLFLGGLLGSAVTYATMTHYRHTRLSAALHTIANSLRQLSVTIEHLREPPIVLTDFTTKDIS